MRPYPLTIDTYQAPPGRAPLEIEPAGWFNPPRLLAGGSLALRGEEPGKWLLTQADGSALTVHLRTPFLDPVPQVIVDGHTLHIARPLCWYHWLWSAFPLILLILGGLLGGLVGAAALAVNIRLFRARLGGILTYLVTMLVSAAAVFAYFVLAFAIDATF